MEGHSPNHSHGHNHDHAHQHHQGHGEHAHQHPKHKHKHEATSDQWVGAEYLNYPGLRELAKVSHESTMYALESACISSEQAAELNLLEVGCVTQHYANSFASVHAIDVSPSMLITFSSELPTDRYANVTHSLHTLNASSTTEFKSGNMKSPIAGNPERESAVPRSQWDVAVSNLVLHHVDDIPGFMAGLTGLVVDGGWVVLTEFTNLGNGHKETESGSVNAPHHHHHEFTVDSITKLLTHFGLQDVHAEVRGTMRIWRNDRFHNVDCLIARGRKASTTG